MRVFVTDGDNRAALAVTRSLGRAGHEVFVGERRAPALAQTSKHCTRRFVYPDPTSESQAFVEFLERTVRDEHIDVLLPVSDITTFLVTRERARLGRSAVPFADAETVALAADKVALVGTAEGLGVPVPRSQTIRNRTELPLDLSFPLVIKPHRSRAESGGRWMSSVVSFASTRGELQRDLAARPDHEFPLLLQERVEGPGLGVFALYHQGRCTALFSHRRVRERPPWGGVSVLSESVPLCPRATDYATRLLDALGWHGVAMVEFKQDRRDGTPKLMEINGRFWGSLQLAIDAGVDFPKLLVDGVAGEIAQPASYRVGVRNRWFWGDVDSLLLTLAGRTAPGTDPGSRVRAVVEFLKLGGRNLYYENPKLRDLKPWWFESVSWFRTNVH